MNRQLLSSLAAIAATTSPALALLEHHQDEFINGLGNKASTTEAALSDRAFVWQPKKMVAKDQLFHLRCLVSFQQESVECRVG